MDFEDLKNLYEVRLQHNPKAYEEISVILDDARLMFERDRLMENPNVDFGQSWRAWKGKNFEKLVHFIVCKMIEDALPLRVISGSVLERRRVDLELGRVKRNLLVDFGVHGCFVPDADIVVYSPIDGTVKAIISCKITLRERIAQSGYWKLRLMNDAVTEHIKVLFVTPDEDGTLIGDKTNKSKAIALNDLDGTYVLRDGIDQNPNPDLMTLEEIVEELRRCL